MKVLWHAAAFVLLATISAGDMRAEIVEKVVAVVNNRIMTLSELQQEMKTAALDPASEEHRSAALEGMIDRALIDQLAAERKISITDAEVKTIVKMRREELGLDEESLAREIKSQNITEEAFYRQWKYQILSRRLIDSAMRGNIAITEEEIEAYHREHYGEENLDSEEQTKIAHILVTHEKENARAEITKVAELAKAGEPFEKLAKEYSMDAATAENGGNLGYFTKGDLIAEIERAAAKLEVGEISAPVNTQAGYHIIKVLERKEKGEIAVSRYKDRIKQEIYSKKVEDFIRSWLSDIRENSYVEKDF